MKTDVLFDLREIKRAIKQLQPHVKQSRRELTEQAAKGFVKEVVDITPPAAKGKRGSAVSVVDSFRQFRITLINAVKYVTNVADYDRRIQSAITIQANKMRRKAEFLLTRALKRGGWK